MNLDFSRMMETKLSESLDEKQDIEELLKSLKKGK
jgi:hypothetical protein